MERIGKEHRQNGTISEAKMLYSQRSIGILRSANAIPASIRRIAKSNRALLC